MHCVTPFLRQTNNLLVFNFDEPQSCQTVFGALECFGKRGKRCSDRSTPKAVKIGIWGANSKIHPNSLTSLGGKCHVRGTAPPAIEAEPEPDYDLPALPLQEGADA